MKDAIEKAIEEGWLNPFFWQCLGNALGWGADGHNWSTGGEVCDYCGAVDPEGSNKEVYDQCWLYHWHRFIDSLAEGKSADDFFNELLK